MRVSTKTNCAASTSLPVTDLEMWDLPRLKRCLTYFEHALDETSNPSLTRLAALNLKRIIREKEHAH